MTEEVALANREAAMQRLKELVLDHLGIPRPKQSTHIQILQDQLLPDFSRMAWQAWYAASRMARENDPIYSYLAGATETQSSHIATLNSILEEMGIHDLLHDVAASPEATVVEEIPVDSYEERLLRDADHRKPSAAVLDFLRFAGKNPQVLAASEKELGAAEQALLHAHSDLATIVQNQQSPAPAPLPSPTSAGSAAPVKAVPETGATSAGAVAPAKPKRLRLCSSLGKLASGLVLLSGNAIVIPTITLGALTALPILGSLAAGIAAVGEGVSNLRREGE